MDYQRAIETLRNIFSTKEYGRITQELTFEERMGLINGILAGEVPEDSLSFLFIEDDDENLRNLFTPSEFSTIISDKKNNLETRALFATFASTEDKVKFLEENGEELSRYDVSNIIYGIEDESQKVSLAIKYKSKLTEYNIATIIKSLSDVDQKIALINGTKDILESAGTLEEVIINTVKSTEDVHEKIGLLNEYYDVIGPSTISTYIKTDADESQKLILFEEFKEKLDVHGVVEIISSFKDDASKLLILRDQQMFEKLGADNIARIISSFKDDTQKKQLLESPGIIEKLGANNLVKIIEILGEDNIARIISSFKDDTQKKQLLESPGIIEKLGADNVARIISSFKDDTQKKQLSESPQIFKMISSHGIMTIVSSIESDIARIEFLNDTRMFSKLDFNDIPSVLLSIKVYDEETIKITTQLINKFSVIYDSSEKTLMSIIASAKESSQKPLVEACEYRIETIRILRKIRNTNSFEEMKNLIIENKDRISKEDVMVVLNSADISLSEKLLLMKHCEKFDMDEINSYLVPYICPNYNGIGEGAKKELSERVLKIIGKYESVEPSVSSLSALISRQAKINFAEKRRLDAQNHSYKYLPSGLAEEINSIVSKNAQKRSPIFNIYYQNMLYVTGIDEYKKRAIADKLKTCNSWDRKKLIDKVNESSISQESIKKRFDLIKNAEGNLTLEQKEEIERILFEGKNLTEEEKRKLYGEGGITLEGIKSLSPEKLEQLENVLGVVLTMNGMKKSLGVEWTEEESKLFLLLEEQLNIKRDNPELLMAYYSAILEVLKEQGKDLSSLFSRVDTGRLSKQEIELEYKKRAEELKRIFELATQKVIQKAIEDKNRNVAGGLLTQVCTYALNSEQRIEEEKEAKALEASVVRELLLTEKGREKVDTNRVIEILKRDSELYAIFEDENIRFSDKMNMIFSKLYPGYQGKDKSLKVLHSLMLKDEKHREELSKEPTFEEKLALPIKPYYFKIDKELQQEKLMVSILSTINANRINPGKEKLDSRIVNKINTIEASVDLMISGGAGSREVGLLMFDDLDTVSHEAISNLLTFYKTIKTSKMQSDVELLKKELNIDNLKEYVDRSQKHALRGSKYYATLGEVVMGTLKTAEVPTYYQHYIRTASKRMYRTIPDIKETYADTKGVSRHSESNIVTCRSYDVDDPEQLIAGVRFDKSPKPSCFQLGHPQAWTLDYITSSPNGIIIAFENEKGEFLGRVYGYRIGNAVHFTRIYCMSHDNEFDYGKAMKTVGQSIIDNSEDIEYVTCIPATSISGEYEVNGAINIARPDDIVQTQDSVGIQTDHGSYDKISVIASRHPILKPEDVTFEREEITEKFYKKRSEPREINISKDEKEKSEQLMAASNIIFRSGCDRPNDIIDYLSTCERVVLGEDYVIIDTGENILYVKINYGESEEAKKYNAMVDEEIKDEVKKIKAKKQEKEQEKPMTEIPLDGLSKEQLLAMREEVEEAQNKGGRSM